MEEKEEGRERIEEIVGFRRKGYTGERRRGRKKEKKKMKVVVETRMRERRKRRMI